MKFYALCYETRNEFIKSLYNCSYNGSPYVYIVSSPDVLKCKRYKTFSSALKAKDKLDSYYESRGEDIQIKILEVLIDIKTTELC